jgi:hypothetical protein
VQQIYDGVQYSMVFCTARAYINTMYANA